MTTTQSPKKETGLLGVFDSQANLLLAVKKLRVKLGVKNFESFSPFPVHGMEHAMGLKRSWLPRFTLVMALIGCSLGFLLQYWTLGVDWPLNIGGKPFVAWQAYVPITFETTILIGGVSSVLLFYIFICGLPNFDKKVLDPRLSDDHFGILVDSTDSNFNASGVEEIFKECHAKEIKNID